MPAVNLWPPPRKPWPLICQTWPEQIPDHRSYAFCHYARQIPISQHDARPMRDLVLRTQVPGVLLMEWDIAFDGEDFRAVCQRAGDAPDEGFVMAHKLWPGPNWGHRHVTGTTDPWWHMPDLPADWHVEFVKPGDADCDLPVFGAIYIPRHILEAWEAPPHDPRLTDTSFGLWSYHKGIKWPIDWDHQPVHLHY